METSESMLECQSWVDATCVQIWAFEDPLLMTFIAVLWTVIVIKIVVKILDSVTSMIPFL